MNLHFTSQSILLLPAYCSLYANIRVAVDYLVDTACIVGRFLITYYTIASLSLYLGQLLSTRV